MKKSTTKKEIINELINKENKYFDLVWYARSSRDSSVEGLLENCYRIEKTFPKEVEELTSGKHTSWHHGFNSGMLAGMRYVLDLYSFGIEAAEEEFPNLDS